MMTASGSKHVSGGISSYHPDAVRRVVDMDDHEISPRHGSLLETKEKVLWFRRMTNPSIHKIYKDTYESRGPFPL